MAKRVIRLSKPGSPAAGGPPSNIGIKQPKAPVKIGAATQAKEDLSRTQPMKRIVVASSGQKRRRSAVSSVSAARTGGGSGSGTQQGQQQGQQRRPQQKSGPPLWLIPVGIVGLVVIIVLIFSSVGRQQDPYFAAPAPQPQEQPGYVRNNGPRPMKEWMEQHGETDMAKARRARRTHRPVTTATTSSGE